MADKPLLKPFAVLVNGDMSGNLISKVTILNGMSMFQYQVTWSGTAPVGVISIQTSLDYTQDATGNVANPGTWNTLPCSGPGTVSGATGIGTIDATITSGNAIRFIYTRTSGTGLLQGTIKAGVA